MVGVLVLREREIKVYEGTVALAENAFVLILIHILFSFCNHYCFSRTHDKSFRFQTEISAYVIVRIQNVINFSWMST